MYKRQFVILSYYSVVGGWCVKYLFDSLCGELVTNDPKVLQATFGALVGAGLTNSLWHFSFLTLTCGVVALGVVNGIERLSKYLLPTLFILMIVIMIRSLSLPGAMEGVKFLFMPRWEDFSGSALFNAMGFCFFSLSLGAGTMITYGTYLSDKANLPGSVGWVAVLAILSSLLGGLMVMPAVFAFGLDPAAGPGLTFVTMPAIFAKMPMGQLFAVFFYVCLVVAALTSSVSMLEACTALLSKEFNLPRRTAIFTTVAGAAVVGLIANLSFGAWSDVKFFGKNIFDLLDFVTSNVGMPLSTFGIAIAAAWVAWPVMRNQLNYEGGVSDSWLKAARILIGVISPLFVLIVALGGLFG